jgi:hypothetical protein
MTVFEKDNKKILYVHIPKTGGTTIKKTFEESGWNVTWFNSGRHPDLNLAPAGVKTYALAHLYYDKLDNIFNLEKDFDYIFTITRNPYDRIVSEYNYRRAYSKSPFNEWFETVKTKALETDMWFNDNHMRLQSEYIGPAINKIYKFEDGHENILKEIESKFDIKFLNTSRADNKSTKKLSVDEIDKEVVYEFYKNDFELLGYDK